MLLWYPHGRCLVQDAQPHEREWRSEWAEEEIENDSNAVVGRARRAAYDVGLHLCAGVVHTP